MAAAVMDAVATAAAAALAIVRELLFRVAPRFIVCDLFGGINNDVDGDEVINEQLLCSKWSV